ncbi:MAG: putative porin [Prevotella sp.]|nr:putative porin [Prevotella sp.]
MRQQRVSDSIQSQHKEIHTGLHVWTIDERFGDRTPAEPDTLSYMFMNTTFTTGLRGEYNTTGNLGAPRQSRIFIDRNDRGDFIFTHPFSYFIIPVSDFHFTNTLTPVTNLGYHSCGDRTNGEDHLKAAFAVNAGKRLGVGFKFNYLYGRGYYSDISAALFNYTMYGSYLGDRYEAHLLTSLNHQKQAENGGITNDNYVTHPEIFNDNYSEGEIPTVMSQNWNRNDNQHIFFSHRYNVGFNRQVPMTPEEIEAKKFAMKSQEEKAAADAKNKARAEAKKNGMEFDEEEYEEQLRLQATLGRPDTTAVAPSDTSWVKNEYVPVTSFIHTVSFNNYDRIYQAYKTPKDYYAEHYDATSPYGGDSIYDNTRHYELRNTLAIAMLEGFNKWVKTGLKIFATHSFRHYKLPDDQGGWAKYNEQSLLVGGQLSKTQGNTFHYNVTGEFGVVGDDVGAVSIDANADLNFRLWGDTIQLAAKGFFHLATPSFYYDHYHSKHYWWDQEMKQVTHSRVEGLFSLRRTKTRLRVAVDNLQNYAYFGTSFNITETQSNGGITYGRSGNAVYARQTGENISLLTAQLSQEFRLGPLHLDAVVTYQNSSHEDIIPVPDLNIYGNLYLRFKIAKVLKCDLGADMRWFTKYHAPEYVPGIAQFAVQENPESRVEIGNYPIINAYANFHLKQARFFVMLSHVNAGDGGNYFFTPHYPLNTRVFRFGISWNFFN